MPIYASAFFVPTSASIPYILEDIYLRGGYRSVATIAERDAIKTAARKQGMLCYVREDQTIYWLPNSVIGGATAWEVFDVTKYVNFKWVQPLSIDEDLNVSIDEKRILPLIQEGDNGFALIATAEGPKWQTFDPLPSRDTAEMGWGLLLDAEKNLIWGPVTGLPPTDGVPEGSAVIIGPDGPEWGQAGGKRSPSEITTSIIAAIGGQGTNNVEIPSAVCMILRLAISNADVLVEIHSSPTYNDTNPYKFRSSSAMLEDDGTTVTETGDTTRQRRYAFFSADSKTDPKMYVRITNESAATVNAKIDMTVLPME